MLDTLMCQAYYNPFIIQILDQFVFGKACLPHYKNKIFEQRNLFASNLFLMNLPPQFIDKTFGEMYERLTLDFRMVPLGLYRPSLIKRNPKPYVFLKPAINVKLNAKDRVYVLSMKQPKDCRIISSSIN